MTNIFFIMPFRPGLNFMYLHMKHFIEAEFEGARCVRGDTNISTGAPRNIRATVRFSF